LVRPGAGWWPKPDDEVVAGLDHPGQLDQRPTCLNDGITTDYGVAGAMHRRHPQSADAQSLGI